MSGDGIRFVVLHESRRSFVVSHALNGSSLRLSVSVTSVLIFSVASVFDVNWWA